MTKSSICPHGPGALLGIKDVVTLTDGDGDKSIKDATVTLINGQNSFVSFDDDGPARSRSRPRTRRSTACSSTASRRIGDAWGTGSGTAIGTAGGWTITPSDVGGGVNPQLEKVADNYRGAHSPTGSLMVDMEASPGNVELSQLVTAGRG